MGSPCVDFKRYRSPRPSAGSFFSFSCSLFYFSFLLLPRGPVRRLSSLRQLRYATLPSATRPPTGTPWAWSFNAVLLEFSSLLFLPQINFWNLGTRLVTKFQNAKRRKGNKGGSKAKSKAKGGNRNKHFKTLEHPGWDVR